MHEIIMPQAGNTMEDGTIIAWRKAEGDQVAAGEVLLEIETDKATIEVESPAAGTLLKILAEEDQTIPVKQIIALLGEAGEDAEAYLAAKTPEAQAVAGDAAPAPEPVAQAPASKPQAGAGPVGGRVGASPAARKIAAEKGVELASAAPGSGPDGRVLSSDVQALAAAGSPAAPGQVVRTPMTKMRRAIGRNLQASKQQVPHFYASRTVDAGPLMAFYCARKAEHACSVNDVIVLACGRVLMEIPAFRTQIDGDDLIVHPSANIGIAVGVEDGLVVPVIPGVEKMSLADLAGRTRQAAQSARDGKIEGAGQGVFTITNLGMFGLDEFSAIINPPESAILAVGTVRDEAIVSGPGIRAGQVVTLTISADHRVIDGIVSAKFLARLAELLAQPELLT